MNDFQLYESLSKQYSALVPNQVEGLVVVWLYEKIQQEEIDKKFTYTNIEEAIREVAISLSLESQPQTENVLTSLFHHFIERLGGNYERFTLTEYAKKFVRLIEGKLNSSHKHFPLRQSFDRYAHFKAGDIDTAIEFESWYTQGFDNTTRQTILDHIESLRDEVSSALTKLNQILFAEDEQSALQMANKFTTTFRIFGEKANQIAETLTLDFHLKTEIQNVIDKFYARLETSVSTSNQTALDDAYQGAVDIQEKVNEFFKIVNEKLERIRNQIIFASSKLNELQEHFKYQSRYKINLRKMLTLILEEGLYTKEDLALPDAFPLKNIPYEGFKFIEMAHYDSFGKPLNKVIELKREDEHRHLEGLKMEGTLSKQEKVTEWLEYYQLLLKKEKTLNFKEHFYRLSREEGGTDLAMQVSFELFRFANGEEQYVIDIEKPLAEQLDEQKVITWNMKIHQR